MGKIKVDFYSGNAEYFTRLNENAESELFSICHVSLNDNDYAVVRGTDKIDDISNWIQQNEKVIFEDDPILKNYIVKDYGIFKLKE